MGNARLKCPDINGEGTPVVLFDFQTLNSNVKKC